jgi:nicotinate-nucleotide adenylyltransferase
MEMSVMCKSIIKKTGCPVRIGLFGGTFNPIHHGHIQVAKEVLLIYQLAAIDFLPSAIPPHKGQGTLATAPDRLEMVRLALVDEPVFNVSDVEIQRYGPSYTIDTLRYFSDNCAKSAELFFIVGLDAFLEIDTWKSFLQMFSLAAFIVMARPQGDHCPKFWQTFAADFVQQRISVDYRLSDNQDALIHPQKRPIYLASVTPRAVSSSQIRKMIRQGRSIDGWVAPSVAAYIEKKGLYR